MRSQRRILTTLICSGLLVAGPGCGGDSDSTGSSTVADTTATTTTSETSPSSGTPVEGLGATVTMATAGRSGAVVQSVEATGTRLRPADVITEVNGKPVESLEDLTDVVEAPTELGASFQITVYRGSNHFTLEEVASPTVYLGVEVQDPSKGEEGLLVKSITPDSPAEEAGIEKDDVIVAIDGRPLESGDELVNAVATHEAGDVVTLSVTRGSRTEDVSVTIADRG